MVDPMHFEAQAANYARARPPYPAALWKRLADHKLLRPGDQVLELGAGTGQATGPLLDAGLRVTAVEPGPRLADQLKAEHPAATVIVSRAEDIDLPAASFDIAVAATSIHWMDLDAVLPIVHRLLISSGKLLVWRNVFGDPSATTPFRDRVAEIVRARNAPPRPGPDAEDVYATSTELTKRGLFAVDDISTFRWSIELDSEQVRRLFSTFSDWSAPEVDRIVDAVADLGGRVIEHYTSWLIVLSPARHPSSVAERRSAQRPVGRPSNGAAGRSPLPPIRCLARDRQGGHRDIHARVPSCVWARNRRTHARFRAPVARQQSF